MLDVEFELRTKHFSISCSSVYSVCAVHIYVRLYTYSIYIHIYICDTCICVFVLYVQRNLSNEVSSTSLLLICNLLFGGS